MKLGRSAPRPFAPVATVEPPTVCGATKSSTKKRPALSWEGNGSHCLFSGTVLSKQMLNRERMNKKSVTVDTAFNRFHEKGELLAQILHLRNYRGLNRGLWVKVPRAPEKPNFYHLSCSRTWSYDSVSTSCPFPPQQPHHTAALLQIASRLA